MKCLAPFAAAVCAIAAGACSVPGPHEIMQAAIRTQVKAAGFSLDMSNEWYSSGAEPSQVLPATYYWALYYPPELSHGWLSVIVAETGGRTVILRDIQDWAAIQDGWQASTPEEALTACMEMIRYAGPRSDPFNLPILVPPAPLIDPRVAWNPATDSLVATLTAPAITSDEGRWTVNLWAMEMARTTQYKCSLAAAGRDDLPHLEVLDSVHIGLFADEH